MVKHSFCSVFPNTVFADLCCLHIVVYAFPEVVSGPKNVTARLSQNVQFTCEFRAPTYAGVSIVVWLKDGFGVILSSAHYNITSVNSLMTTDSIKGESYHLMSSLSILNITDDDEGKYTCYCYYNTSLVTSIKHKYVTSNLESANLHITSGGNNHDHLQLYATISSGITVTISVIIIWIVGIALYKRYHTRPKLVNLKESSSYDDDDIHGHDEKQPLLEDTTQGNTPYKLLGWSMWMYIKVKY